MRWWNEHRFEDDLGDFLRAWMPKWLSGKDRHIRSFLITSTLAAGEGAFVEQRLLTRCAALELLNLFLPTTPIELRGSAGDSPKGAASRLRGLLKAASISPDIPIHSPDLATYVEHVVHIGHGTVPQDGPSLVIKVRNDLAHPKVDGHLYEPQWGNVIAYAAELAGRYLDLLLLWEVGYQGHVRDRTHRRTISSASDPAPWVPPTAPTDAP